MRRQPVFAELNESTEVAPSADRLDASRAAVSLAVPREGHVLSTVAEQYGGPLRAAVSLLSEAIQDDQAQTIWQQLYACRRVEPGVQATSRPATELCAWAAIAAWAVGVATRALPCDATLSASDAWFLGSLANAGLARMIPDATRVQAEALLHEVADASALAELLPYILDPHGEGSRLSVRRRPETAAARARKRADGVYYTPGDVAAYMAAETVRQLGDDAMPVTVFDPACGSGVFLRAVLAELVRMNPGADVFDMSCSCLYGADIDPWSISASAFVLLHDCFASVHARRHAPIAAWHALRLNLAQLDTLRLDAGQELMQSHPDRIARLECRARLKAGDIPAVSGTTPPTGSIPFHIVFPELAQGPRVVIGNPPYAGVGSNADLLSLAQRFETLRAAPRPSSDIYPLFLEQMIRLTAPDAHGGAMVLPLSIACNTGRQFRALRILLARTPGHWRFAFFDREPHALFGEDVKTRNAIVLWTRHSVDASVTVSTGPLRKWRGHNRARMFESIAYTPVGTDIRAGIPKVEGSLQAIALERLHQETDTLNRAVTRIGRATLEEALRGDNMTVYVGATAYNFLNVFLQPRLQGLNQGAFLTENPLHALHCPSPSVALQVFALLSSRLAFWWWHAHGDGFHVSRHVLETTPVGRALVNANCAIPLAMLGEKLWSEIAATPVVSVNRGRTSFGFTAASRTARGEIDRLFVEALGLTPDFVPELTRFCDGVVSAKVSNA